MINYLCSKFIFYLISKNLISDNNLGKKYETSRKVQKMFKIIYQQKHRQTLLHFYVGLQLQSDWETILVLNPFKARFSCLKWNVQFELNSNFNLVLVIKKTLKYFKIYHQMTMYGIKRYDSSWESSSYSNPDVSCKDLWYSWKHVAPRLMFCYSLKSYFLLPKILKGQILTLKWTKRRK